MCKRWGLMTAQCSTNISRVWSTVASKTYVQRTCSDQSRGFRKFLCSPHSVSSASHAVAAVQADVSMRCTLVTKRGENNYFLNPTTLVIMHVLHTGRGPYASFCSNL